MSESKDWSRPTEWMDRFQAALTLICRLTPPRALCESWVSHESEDLQSWAFEHSPAWAQGIVVIDAAEVLASTPTEGAGHGDRPWIKAKVEAVETTITRIYAATDPIWSLPEEKIERQVLADAQRDLHRTTDSLAQTPVTVRG